MSFNYWVVVYPIATVFCILMFFIYYLRSVRPRAGTTEWITCREHDNISLSGCCHRLDSRDTLPIIIITVIYAFVAFFLLGSRDAPESFHKFESSEESVTIGLLRPVNISNIMYYTGLIHGHYKLELSRDGQVWEEQTPAKDEKYAMEQSYADLFKWQYANISSEIDVKFLRITASKSGMELGELAIYDELGTLLNVSEISADDCQKLFDEREIIPDSPSWYNSMYFDEIYHGRAAYEFLQNDWPYEATHPPLGKVIIAAGVAIFGMNPFGWRFMGTLFGVLMLPLLYILLKRMFGRRAVAVCGTLIFAFDFMHYTQTRISTIDTYSVFFTILMYLFMYRFISVDYDAPLKKSLRPLFLSGLFFGFGIASKWTAAWAGAGLAVIYLIHHIIAGRYYVKSGRSRLFIKRLIITLLMSLLFFVVIPAVIYCMSYIPYGLAEGMSIRGGMLFDGDYYKMIWDNQVSMLSYHGKLTATHPYQSSWYQWIFNIRPILYFLDTSMGEGLKSAIVAFGNPLVWWGGLGAFCVMVWRTVRRRDGRALIIVIGYLFALIPWIIISRCAFAYHYFTCSLFLCIALAHTFNTLLERRIGRPRLAVYGYTAGVLLLFAAFYPVLSGIAVPQWYTTNFLRWLYLSWPI